MALQNKLIELGFSLPELSKGNTVFQPFLISGNQVYISGQLPLGFGDISLHKGQVGNDFTLEQAQKVAEYSMLNVLAQLNEALMGDLNKLKRCLKITVFVNSGANFTDQPKVANAASELLIKALGEKGNHTRSAIGVAQLPLGVAVEIEATFELI